MHRPTQEELDEQERLHASIVDGLRRAGWEKWHAIAEADYRMARRIASPTTEEE